MRGREAGHSARSWRTASIDSRPGDLDVVDVAAVAGDQIDVTLIASALDRSTADVLDSLERTEAAGLVGPGAGHGRFAFTHDVYRSVRYASLTTSRRLRLHAALAQALAERSSRRRDGECASWPATPVWPAHGSTRPSPPTSPGGPANAAADATDHGEAAAHYRRALEVLDIVPDPDDGPRLELSIRLGASLVLLGDRRRPAQCCKQRPKTRIGRAIQSLSPGPSARWRRCREGPRSNFRGDRLFRSLAEAALEMLPPSEEAWRIRVLARLGSELWFADEPRPWRGDGRSAVRAARQAR